LFVRDGVLFAQAFDANNLQLRGEAVPIADQIDNGRGRFVQKQFSVSQNGVLAYTSGALEAGQHVLAWFDRSGKAVGTLGEQDIASWGAISPDGKIVAADRLDPQSGYGDVWIYDLARGAASRFTFGPKSNYYPVWSPDGRRIAFLSLTGAEGRPVQKAVSGVSEEEALAVPVLDPPRGVRVDDWSRDGRYVIEAVRSRGTAGREIWVLPLFGDHKPFPYLRTGFSEQFAKLSPNGQWLAYTSNESKRNEVYVQSFPTPGGKWQISTNGGERSIWSRDGKELYFVSVDQKMMAVEISGGPRFEASVPKALFDVRFPGGNAWFDVSKDGRFLIPVAAEQSAAAPLTVVLNWQAGLKK